MTAIDDKKTELEEKIERLPNQIQSARDDAVGKYLLALEMQDGSGDAMTDGTLAKCAGLGIIKSAIKGKAASASSTYTARHTGSYPYDFQSSYAASDGLSGPTLTSFGFQFTPVSTGDLTDANCADYYLVNTENDDGDLVLCNMTEHGEAFTTPSRITAADLIISDDVRTQGAMPYTFIGYAGSDDFTNRIPIFKETDPTVEIYVDAEKVADVDQYGLFTNVTNTINVTLDVDSCIFNFGSGQTVLVFTSIPITANAAITLKYDYVATSVAATPQSYDSFNTTNYVFKTVLTDEPVLYSLKILLNGEQKAMIMDTGVISGMSVKTNYSYYDPDTYTIKLRFQDIVEGNPTNTVVTEYTIKDEQTETSSLGHLNSSSLTYNVEIPTDNPDILEDNFKLSFVEDYTEDTETRTDMTVTLSGTTISGTYVTQNGAGVVSGTLTQATDTVAGSVSITLSSTMPTLATPPSDSVIMMTFDHLSGKAEWEETYDYIPINSVSTLVSGVDAGVSMTKINITATKIDVVPSLLSTYHVRKYSDHSLYGYITIICWGLQINQSWTWYTGSATVPAAESCMELDHDDFVSLFGWIDLANSADCDIIASIDPANSSSPSEYPDDSGAFPYLYDQPYFPATPPEFQEDYLYRASYHKTKKEGDPLADVFNYSVNSDIRWTFDVMPSEDDMMASTYSFTNYFQTAVDAVGAFSSASVTTIPQSSAGYPPSSAGQTYTTYSVDDSIEGFYIVYKTVYTSESDGGEPVDYIWGSGVDSEFSCYFNDLQHLMYDGVSSRRNHNDGVSNQTDINGQTAILQTLSYTDTSAETTFYAAVDSFDTVRAALIAYHTSWVSSFDTSSSTYAYTTTSATNYTGGCSTFSTAMDTELSSIGSRMGSPTSAGYVKNLYDAINLMLALDIEYIKKLVEDFVTMEGMFQTAVDDHDKWDLYDGI